MMEGMRKRAMPYVGRPVAIVHLAVVLEGVIEAMEDDGRSLTVLSEEGERMAFLLDAATGGFTQAGGQTSVRLRFREE
jgi:hypothetical protein